MGKLSPFAPLHLFEAIRGLKLEIIWGYWSAVTAT